jgi:hypothetical protein
MNPPAFPAYPALPGMLKAGGGWTEFASPAS